VLGYSMHCEQTVPVIPSRVNQKPQSRSTLQAKLQAVRADGQERPLKFKIELDHLMP
jgi:hypothetical protein